MPDTPSLAADLSLWSLCLSGQAVVTPETLWSAWSLAPSVLLPLGIAVLGLVLAARTRRGGDVASAQWPPATRTANEGMQPNPNTDIAPSGALEQEGQRPVLERSRKVR